MSDTGVELLFERDSSKMIREAMVLIRGVHIVTLYMFLGNVDSTRCKSTTIYEDNLIVINSIVPHLVDQTMFWNQRMGHAREKGLRYMHNKGMVEGFPDFSLEVDLCEHYIYGKHNCLIFPSRATREKGILELINSDVFGLVPIQSLGVSLYCVSLIDDSLGRHGCISLEINQSFLVSLNILNLLCKTIQIRGSR